MVKKQRPADTWTPREIAEVLRINPRQVRELITSGKLRAYKKDGDWYVRDDEFKRYFESLVTKA
ncbi:MAG: helix-turn-helix domain-containing protein [Anaerolineae bacterium]|nr:helix-turn-helix domain-containing protein [Anaerolineae bacterium]